MEENKPPSEFYLRMLEAKRKKKVLLEQQRIRAEFGEPVFPPIIPIIVKSAFEQQLDKASALIKDKLFQEQRKQQTKQDNIIEAFNDIAKKAQGL